MNERIKQLFKKAGGKSSARNLASSPVQVVETHELWDDHIEKFAELIIRECIDKIETYRIPVGNSAAGEMACEWTYDALESIRDDIKETFGVE